MGYSVAIDGPAGAGKSTIAKRIAKEMGFEGRGRLELPPEDETGIYSGNIYGCFRQK